MDENFDRELAAISDLGERRSRVRTAAFVVGYVGACVAFVSLQVIGIYIGFIYVGVASVPIAGAIAMAVTRARTPALIAAVSKKHDIPAEELGADRYLVS